MNLINLQPIIKGNIQKTMERMEKYNFHRIVSKIHLKIKIYNNMIMIICNNNLI